MQTIYTFLLLHWPQLVGLAMINAGTAYSYWLYRDHRRARRQRTPLTLR